MRASTRASDYHGTQTTGKIGGSDGRDKGRVKQKTTVEQVFGRIKCSGHIADGDYSFAVSPSGNSVYIQQCELLIEQFVFLETGVCVARRPRFEVPIYQISREVLMSSAWSCSRVGWTGVGVHNYCIFNIG